MKPIALSPPETTEARANWPAFGLCFAAYLLGGTVSTLLSVYLPPVLADLGAGPSAGALLNAAFLYGWMVGGFGFGALADRLGRVRALALATGLVGGATLLAVWVQRWEAFAALRFVAGAGVGGVLVVSTIYVAETWPERSRPVALGVLATAFPVGLVGSGALNLLFDSWREAFGMGAVLLGLAPLVAWGLRESQKWAVSRQKTSARPSRLFSPENRGNLLRGSLVFGSVLVGLWAVFSWTPSWVQTLFATEAEARPVRGLTMMLFGLGGIAGGALSGFLVKTVGLRATLLGTFAGCLLACWLLFGTNQRFSPLIYGETALLSLCFGISQGTLSTFIPMLFPTAVRATATGFCFNVGRLLTATGVFFVGSLVAVFGGLDNALLFFSLTFVAAFAATWFGPKTNPASS